MIINFRAGTPPRGDHLRGSVVNKTSCGFVSVGSPAVIPNMLPIITLAADITAPINVVIAGQQPEQKKATPLTGIPSWARGIFGE